MSVRQTDLLTDRVTGGSLTSPVLGQRLNNPDLNTENNNSSRSSSNNKNIYPPNTINLSSTRQRV